jgi:hypothetical protein
MDRKDIYVGMKVKVFDVNSRRSGQPDGGWDGTVTAVRRTKCDIDYGDARQRTFGIESQHVEDAYRHRYFRTLEEAETVARTSAARAVINDKIVREGMSRIPLEKLEAIAAILQEET